jgi:hypothetical protein
MLVTAFPIVTSTAFLMLGIELDNSYPSIRRVDISPVL